MNGHRRVLLPGILLALLCALVSGLLLFGSRSPAWLSRAAVAVHLVTGLGVFAPLLYFLRRHWWQRRQRVARHPNTRFGYVAATALLLLLLSGVGLLRWTSWAPLRYLHGGAALLLTLDLGLHASWRYRRRLRRTTFAPLGAATAASALLIAGGGLIISQAATIPTAASTANGATPLPVAHGALVDFGGLPTAVQCAACHGHLTQSWAESAHAYASRNPYYQALTTLFMQERGVEASRYCAECHNPVGLLQGEIDRFAASSAVGGEHAYEARALGVALPMSDAAAEGVTCVLCHRAATPGGSGVPGLLTGVSIPGDPLETLALRAAPDEHREAFMPDIISEAALCAACHNLATPDGLLLEPTYDEWLASPYPGEGVTCQACHMLELAGRGVDSTLGGATAAHGGVPGAPSSLPDVSRDTTLLQTAATLEVGWEAGPAGGVLVVQVTNSGAGHYLPTGADDLRQIWLEVTVRDGAGRLVWQRGALAAGDRLPLDAIQFRKVLGDEAGRPIDLHRFWVATRVLEDTRLGPRETRAFKFDITIEPAGTPYTVTARILYRDVPPDFAEFALGEPLTQWPPLEMAVVTREVP